MKKLLLFLLRLFSRKTTAKPEPIKPIPFKAHSNELGFTLDRVDNLPAIITAIKAMPIKPYVRIVFDYPESPTAYSLAVNEIAKYAYIIGQPSDSEYNSKMSVPQYKQRFVDYVKAFPQIEYWEACNECNGDWLGPNAIRQTEEAIKVIKEAGKKVITTMYWNTGTCKDKNGLWYEWGFENVTDFIKSQTDIATLSVYGFDCDGPEPSYNQLDTELSRLQSMFPESLVSIGEYGAQSNRKVLAHYRDYSNKGLGLYWFGYQDLLNINSEMYREFVK